MNKNLCALIRCVVTVAILCSVHLLAYSQKGWEASVALQYSYTEYGKLHGMQAPFSIQYRIGRFFTGLSFGWGGGFSNWNYDADPNKNYNFEFDRKVPPYSFWQSSTFEPIEPARFLLKDGSGYGMRLFGGLSGGYRINLGSRAMLVEAGIYFTRVTTQFVAATIEDVQAYNNFMVEFGGVKDPDRIYLVDFLIPVQVRYLDIGPFASIRYQLTGSSSRIPLGIAASCYYGFYDNSWFNLGLYADLPISKSLQ
jgi:hypothetical protein